jgi:hypothetical protein
MILVDSSVLIDYLRDRPTAAARQLDRLQLEREYWGIPLICAQEVLQGARNETEWRALKAHFDAQDLVEPADWRAAHVEAARIFFDCRRRGVTVRSSADCLIAAITLERNDILLHDDADFEAIAKIRPLKTLRS